MKSKLSISIIVAAILAVVLSAFTVNAGESKFASTSSGTSAAVVFGPDPVAQRTVTAVLASSDTAAGAVKLYTLANPTNRFVISTLSTSGAQVVYFGNVNQSVATNDIVVYCHRDGSVDATTVATNVATNGVTLAAGISSAGATNDVICKLTQAAQMTIGTTPLNLAGFTVLVIPVNSPLYGVVTGATNENITVTRQ